MTDWTKIHENMRALGRACATTQIDLAVKVADDNNLAGDEREAFLDKALGPTTIYVGSWGGPATPIVNDLRPLARRQGKMVKRDG